MLATLWRGGWANNRGPGPVAPAAGRPPEALWSFPRP